MNFETLFPAFAVFCASVLLSSCVLHFFPKWNLLDNPRKYGFSRDPIPYPAGIAPILALVFGVLIFFPFSPKFLGLAVGITLVAGISFWDDRRNLPPLFRLCVHFLAAGIIAFSGIRIEFLGNPFGDAFNLVEIFRFLPELITIFWLVAFANVMNWLDGIPGLSAGSAAAAGIFLGILSLTPLVNQPQTASLAFVFAAATGGFLLFNIPPARMLLGDTGAMSFGFFLAALTVFSGGKMATAFLVLAIPLLDAANVILSRILAGRNPLRGADKRHLHDRLSAVGLSDREILLFFLIISIALGWLSLQFGTLGKILLALSVAALFLIFSVILEKILRKKSPSE